MKKRTIIIISLLIMTSLLIDYGWRFFGFKACTTTFPSVTEVKVTEELVNIKGTTYYSGDHYIGYIYEIKDNTLYVGIRYQLLTIFHKGGSFDIEIPSKNTNIDRVYIKGRNSSELIWEKE